MSELEFLEDYGEEFALNQSSGRYNLILAWKDRRKTVLTPAKIKSLVSFLEKRRYSSRSTTERVSAFVEVCKDFQKELMRRNESDDYLETWVFIYTKLKDIDDEFERFLNCERSNRSYGKNKNRKPQGVAKRMIYKRVAVGKYMIEIDLESKSSVAIPIDFRKKPITFQELRLMKKYASLPKVKNKSQLHQGFSNLITANDISINILNRNKFNESHHVGFWTEFLTDLERYKSLLPKFYDWRRKNDKIGK